MVTHAALTTSIQEEGVSYSPSLILLKKLSAIQRQLECVSQTVMIRLKAEAQYFPSWAFLPVCVALSSHSVSVNVRFFLNKPHFILLDLHVPVLRYAANLRR